MSCLISCRSLKAGLPCPAQLFPMMGAVAAHLYTVHGTRFPSLPQAVAEARRWLPCSWGSLRARRGGRFEMPEVR